MENYTSLNEKIEQRKKMLKRVKEGLIERLNLHKTIDQIDDDTPLFGSGLKLDSVDATEIIVFLNDEFDIQVTEGDDPYYMRTINSLTTFILNKLQEKEDV
ncbi:acyl carrier protein [Proteus appendicitidis]|uniref:Phosphopantetheine-binding protein n=1 Tax=Proteus appendicitidis TaxID=3034648 RepID=A0ABY8Y770_9GAMM|nr:phosphopantetheine-binding protein [Proteus sp. HZ0627]WIV88259.1 phosphopantetheine-binding protein [Proteus sp. HZ0627]